VKREVPAPEALTPSPVIVTGWVLGNKVMTTAFATGGSIRKSVAISVVFMSASLHESIRR
jgi:hypothetical protein